MKQLSQSYRIHAGTLATCDPYDQAIISEWINKNLWKLIPMKKTNQSTLNREKPAGMGVPVWQDRYTELTTTQHGGVMSTQIFVHRIFKTDSFSDHPENFHIDRCAVSGLPRINLLIPGVRCTCKDRRAGAGI